jgi:hypothetical protein
LAPGATFAASPPVDYATQIKPILSARCYACHSALRKKSGLRLDTAALLIEGGDSGPAVEPGQADESLLVMMLTGELGTRMPPEGEGEALAAEQIELIKRWINEGAKAPAETPAPDPRDHWAYHPPVRPDAPTVKDSLWAANPIDAFLAADWQKAGVTPIARAEKAVLLRRLFFDLVGLPPTPEELNAFVADNSTDAYERMVDQLLSRPQYGQRWARHWMDVWRYSDWGGYKDEIRTSARHIWRWRDWIVESLNADKGYDRMVVEMLAGDEAAPDDPNTLRATGYLARYWFKFNRNTWLDSTVEHTAKAFIGVTMNCARCHDHKFDPINQSDYYRFRAVFEPYDVRTDRVPGEPDVMKDGLARAFDAKPDDPTYLFKRGNEKQADTEHPMSPGVPESLGGRFEVQALKLPATAFYPALREFVIAEESAKAQSAVDSHDAARSKAQAVVAAVQKKLGEFTGAAEQRQAIEVERDATLAAANFADRQLATARASLASFTARVAAEKAKYGLSPGADAAALALAAGKAEGEVGLCTAQEQVLAAELEKAKPQADKAAADAKVKAAKDAVAVAHVKLATPTSEYKPLGEVSPAASTGRRLALAKWITSRDNPLAARVAVNHIWLRHFGSPLVDNMFDFGLRSPQARNQPLLDWLAVEFMDHGWSMKHVHKLIVMSNAYRMASHAAEPPPANLAVDPDNRLLWRMNPRRLEAEAVRDAMLFVAGKLDQKLGGPEIDQQLASQSPRRSLYLRHAYEKQAKFLELFDGPSVNECYRRGESIVPQQALALENSDLALDQSRQLAGQLSLQSASGPLPDDAFVARAFEKALGRGPTAAEADQCLAFLKTQAKKLQPGKTLTPIAGGPKPALAPSTDPNQRARENLVHVLMNHNDFVTIR